jgi:hypothetical protein
MSQYRIWTDPATGQQFWIDENDMKCAPVRYGNPIQDNQEDEERRYVEGLLAKWDWPDSSTIDKSNRPGTYDFDCSHGTSGETVAIEVKQLPLPQQVMNAAADKRSDEVTFTVREFVEKVLALTNKANTQLAAAQSQRRCVLFVWQYERQATYMWDLLWAALSHLKAPSYPNIDEVWLTTPHMYEFHLVELA